MTVLSLNEVHATAKKATRGAGYPWGLAEEAGQAVRWLCAQSLDGCSALANLLKRIDGTAMSALTPNTNQPIWKPDSSLILCPLIVGAAMSDRANELVHRSFEVTSVAEPSLLFAFAAYCARKTKGNVSLEWANGSAIFDGVQLSVRGFPGPTADFVCMRRGGTLGPPNQHSTRGEPEPMAWETPNEFAKRTYAPATDESRRKGAGAELGDGN